MTFSTLTIASDTFTSVGPGMYSKSTVGLGDPANGIKIAPGKKANARAPVTAAVTRYQEKDVTLAGIVQRLRLSVNVQISVPSSGFTSSEIDSLLSELNTLLTPEIITRIVLGES